MHGSTKTTVKTVVFLTPTRNRKTAFRHPDSRTLDKLADTREYQNDCEDSRFFTPNGESKDDVPSSTLPERSASSLMHGSTKKQTLLCLFLLSRLEIEGRRSVVPIPVRSAGSLIRGSTKTTVRQSFLYDEEKGLTIQNAQRVFGNRF